MRKFLLLLLGMLWLNAQLFAQTRTITGLVTDDKGSPIPNVSVQVKGSSVGTFTKTDGTFTLAVPANGKILVFSSIGLGVEEVTIGSQNQINAQLKVDSKSMEDVVVVGYQSVRRKDVASAVSKISA